MSTSFAFDGPPVHQQASCASCGRDYLRVVMFVTSDDQAVAIVRAACHAHDGQTEVWLDVVVGSFDEPDFADQATFSCRVRPEGTSLFAGPVASEGGSDVFGRFLTPDEARAHRRLDDVWDIVDFVVTTEPAIADAVYGPTS